MTKDAGERLRLRLEAAAEAQTHLEAAADLEAETEADLEAEAQTHLEAEAEARCAAICGDTHTPLSFALADMRAATFIESPYRQ